LTDNSDTSTEVMAPFTSNIHSNVISLLIKHRHSSGICSITEVSAVLLRG